MKTSIVRGYGRIKTGIDEQMDKDYDRKNIWQNGMGTKILSGTMAILLAGAIATGGYAVVKLEGVITEISALKVAVNKLSERVLYLERAEKDE